MIWLWSILRNPAFLWVLLIVNVLGTIYGYIWYLPQLEQTPGIFIPFVPDSPTASLFFCFVLIAFLLKRNWPTFEVLAIITLFKYGVWAIVMNLLTLWVSGDLPWEGYMLMVSHGAMAVQGILYSSFYRVKPWHIVVGAVWAVHNDIIDYVYMQYPVYSQLYKYIQHIGYFTFWLSIASIAIAYYFTQKTTRNSLTL
ncbi:lipoprotein heptaprenylglyceryl N-acetyltransferase LhaT [Rossellomorea marisflavi]|uniref:DUF1405 domain-containing protein n=1 Tax=Rossellomorea marisflavi TaxID=189381 RepID=UPI0011E824BF|nr:DUF1405 domain-containing protein [Rossellomorea marisflavi]TYO72910.1 DUF1405 domain-containing protein [Rossellomorea marisflavi]